MDPKLEGRRVSEVASEIAGKFAKDDIQFWATTQRRFGCGCRGRQSAPSSALAISMNSSGEGSSRARGSKTRYKQST